MTIIIDLNKEQMHDLKRVLEDASCNATDELRKVAQDTLKQMERYI